MATIDLVGNIETVDAKVIGIFDINEQPILQVRCRGEDSPRLITLLGGLEAREYLNKAVQVDRVWANQDGREYSLSLGAYFNDQLIASDYPSFQYDRPG